MDGEGISDGLSAERKVEIRVRKNGRKVIVEKSAAEGLPEGWIKKLVISNKSGRKRRDPFFIDPKSEYIFQSFKAASRYVETGHIGYARKLKESDIEDDDSGNGKNVLLLESAEALLEKEKNIDIYVRNSKQRRNLSSSDEHSENGKMNSDLSIVTSQVLEDLGRKKDVKDPIEKQPTARRVTRSQAKASKIEEDVDVKRMNSSSSNAKSEEDSLKYRPCASSQSPEKKSVMKEEEVRDSIEKRITRNNKAVVKKNELTGSVARRASKRLAGIELELNTRTKAQRVVVADGTAGKCKQPVNPVATSGLKKMDIPLTKGVAKSYNSEHSSPKATSSNHVSAEVQIEKISKSVGRNGSGNKKKMPLVISKWELNPFFHLDGYKLEEEMLPVREKTAAGKRSSSKANKVTSARATKISPFRLSNKGEHPHPHPCDNGNVTQRRNKLRNDSFDSSVVRGTCSEMMEMNTNSFSSSSAFDSTLTDLWKDPCIAFAIKTLTGDSLRLPNNTAEISCDPNNNHGKQKGVAFFPETPVNANTGSARQSFSSELLGADIWKDPCIDFAIKTLTGAIPVGLDEPVVKPKSEGVTITASARQEQEGKQSSSCDYLVQQCSNMKNKTVQQSFSKD